MIACRLSVAVTAALLAVCSAAFGGNLVRDARVIAIPPADSADPSALADLASEEWVGWEPAVAGRLELRVEWDRWRPVEVIVCHWRRMPADYTVELRTDGAWRAVASVAGNQLRDHKIALHQFSTVRARALRIIVTRPVDAHAGVSLRALEVYSLADPPAPVEAFLKRSTPQLLESPETFERWRAEQAGDPLDEELLTREIPTWEPIPRSEYFGKEPGRIVNEKSAARGTLFATLCARHAQTGHEEYARRAWDVAEVLIDHWNRWQGFRFIGREWQAVTFQEPGYFLNGFPTQYERIAAALTDRERLSALYFLMDVADFQYRAILEFTPLPDEVDSRSDLPNWMPYSIGGLTMAAVMLDEFPQADVWVNACDARFPGFFKDIFFLDDGTWWECSPAHHCYVSRGMFPYALGKQLRGEPIWDEVHYGKSYADTLEALARTATPLGEYPSVNDSTGHDAPIRTQYPRIIQAITMMGRGDLLRALQAEPRWPDIAAIQQRPIDLTLPEYRSINQRASGMAVMRDGWERDSAWAMLDYGPHGGGHGQFDKLGIAIAADGHHWIPDAGCAPHYSIFPEQWEWHRQTVSHNTVLIDGQSQSACDGRLLAWHTDDALDFVAAEHAGYAPVVHRRAVLHPRDGYFLVHDTLTATDDAGHIAELLLHVYGEPAGQRPGRLLFRHGDLSLAVHSPLIGEQPVTIKQGLCGGLERDDWHGEGYPGKGDPGWLYIPYVRLPQSLSDGGGRTDFFTVIQPHDGPEPPQMSVEQLPATEDHGPGLRIIRDGVIEVIRWSADETRCTFEQTDDGRMVLSRTFEILQ